MRLPSRKMISQNRPMRSIVPRETPHEISRVRSCMDQDTTMFKDPAHVRKWMATATNEPTIYPGIMPPHLLEHTSIDDAHSRLGISPPDLSKFEYSRVEYTQLLPEHDYRNTEPVADWRIHSGSFSSDDGDRSVLDFRYDVPASAEMAYTRSSQSAAFTSDYSISSGIACSLGSYPQAAYTLPTTRPSPTSAPMNPMYTISCSTSGFLPVSVTSPPVSGTTGAYISGLSAYDDILPGPMMAEEHVQSPDHFNPVDSFQERTIRPFHDNARSRVAYDTFLPPDEINSNISTNTGTPYNVPSRAGRQASNHVNPRDHYLYYAEVNLGDNMYHCPFGPIDGCTHKPEKLKCNYDKHLDSHLKPYRCKYNACSSVPFSSTACLLRHEREAHGMHGHGNNPYMCMYPNCDRGRGFPRRYNLEDHMRRMHGYEPPSNNRRRSVAESGATRPTGIRATRIRRSTTSAAVGPTIEQSSFRINKAASARSSAASRRKSMA